MNIKFNSKRGNARMRKILPFVGQLVGIAGLAFACSLLLFFHSNGRTEGVKPTEPHVAVTPVSDVSTAVVFNPAPPASATPSVDFEAESTRLVSKLNALDVTQYTTKDESHAIAEEARSLGFTEDSSVILLAKEVYAKADELYQSDVDILATTIFNEAWGGCSTRHRELVGAVVMNRVADEDFPDTIHDVICQPRQYNPGYADATSLWGKNARQDPEVWNTCREIAMKVLRGEVDCDPGVVFQAEHIQGPIYEIHDTSYSRTYFCFK